MPATQAFLSFNAGELTPYLRHRTDVSGQASGAELLQNFIAMPFGGVRKRAGTLHVAALSGPTRLESFQFSTEGAYVLAFSDTTLTVFRSDGTQAATLAGTFGDPFLLQFAQINDVVFLTSRGVSPKRLSRNSDVTWTLEEIPFSYPPFLDTNRDEKLMFEVRPATGAGPWSATPNPEDKYVVGNLVESAGRVWICYVEHNPSSSPHVNSNEPGVGPKYRDYWREYYVEKGGHGVIAATGTAYEFQPGQFGGYFEISKRRSVDQFEVYARLQSPTVVPEYSPTLVVKGRWSFITTGTWHGTVYIQRSYDNGTKWEDFVSYTSNNDQNFTSDGYEDRRALFRIRFYFDADVSSVGTTQPRATLTSEEPYIPSLVKITGYLSEEPVPTVRNVVKFDALEDIDLGATEIWREGAFSGYQGYPAAVAVHERRLIFAGTRLHPVSLWTSKTDDLLRFTPGSTEADAPLFITLAATRQDPIRWIASQRRLVVGAAGAEWVFGSDTSDAALSPSNLLVRQYTFFGSAALPSLTMQAGVFFIERQGRKLRELAYQVDQETYDAADLTRLAEHITESGLIQTGWQGNREPALWAVRADGVMVHFSYIRAEKVAAWSRHVTADGKFRSVAVVRNDADDDSVFVVVQRGAGYHLERFAESQQATQEAGTLASCYHVDSGRTAVLTPGTRELAMPAHLEGREVQVLADGYALTLEVQGGKITLPHDYGKVSAGLAVESRLVTLPPELQTDQGTTHGRLKRANSVKLSLYQSYGGTLIYRGQASDVCTTTVSSPLDRPPDLATGWYETTLGGGYEQDLQFEVRHTTPHPFTLRAAAVEWSISEGR